MFRKAFDIAFLYLKNTFSQRAVFIFSFAMPIIFTFVLAFAMQGPGGGNTPTAWTLHVVDEDQAAYSQNLRSRIDADPAVVVEIAERETAMTALEDEDALAVLIIPNGFTTALAEGNTAKLEFHGSASAINQAQILQQTVTAAYQELAGSITVAELSTRVANRVGLFDEGIAQEAYYADSFAAAEAEWTGGAPVSVSAQNVTRLEEDDFAMGITQSAPGMLVMFSMFFTFGGATALIVERDRGTLRRLLVMPMPKATILFGKLLGIFLGGLAQMTILILFAQLFMGINWGQSPAGLALLVVVYAFTITALGMMVAALAHTAARANAMSTIVIMAVSSLGGAWWPIEIVPNWMQTLALTLPTGWAMRGFHDLLTRGLSFGDVLLEAGVLFIFGIGFLLVGLWQFSYE